MTTLQLDGLLPTDSILGKGMELPATGERGGTDARKEYDYGRGAFDTDTETESISAFSEYASGQPPTLPLLLGVSGRASPTGLQVAVHSQLIVMPPYLR